MNKLLTKFIIIPLAYIYLFGLLISGVYFNWQYARENGFFKWILLGQIVPTLQSTIWPYYAAKHFFAENSGSLPIGRQEQRIQPPPDGQVVPSFKEKAWWLTEYPRLNAALDKAGGSLSASYRVGPKGASYVKVQLERGPRKGFTLILDLPPEAIVRVDPNTGKAEPGEERTIWTYRDHDLDGIPDDVFSKSFQKPISKEAFTNDGFMLVRDSADHTSIFVQWTIALGFSTNHFLYGKDSVSP